MRFPSHGGSSPGNEVRLTNLYEENFQPAMSRAEHRGYMTAHRDGKLTEDVKGHVEDLLWCSGLVLCYPTWWYSFPAILKVGLQVVELLLGTTLVMI